MKNKLEVGIDHDAPASPSRRNTIKTLAYGVGALAGTTVLPDKWVTPIIQGIALPAHAQTSAPSQLALAFCNDRVDLTLVAGNSSTGDVTINATGCLSSAEANVTFALTLAGYAHAVVTDTGQSAAGGFLAAVSEAFVPSAHAAQQPLCTQVVSVTTGSDGVFEASFTLTCGPGIVHVVLTANAGGGSDVRAGWLDIPDVKPSTAAGGERGGGDEEGESVCESESVVTKVGQIRIQVDGEEVQEGGRVRVGDELTVENVETGDRWVEVRYTSCAVERNEIWTGWLIRPGMCRTVQITQTAGGVVKVSSLEQ